MKLIKQLEDKKVEMHLAIGELDEYFVNSKYSIKPHEIIQFTAITNTTKKYEWLTARELTEQVLKTKAYVYYRKNGSPYLKGKKLNISFSHGFPYVVFAYAKKGKVGVDVQEIKSTVLRVKQKFLTDKELTFCGNDEKLLTVFWSAKETLFKIYQKGKVDFKKHLHVEFIDEETLLGKFSKGKAKFIVPLKWFQLKNHIVVYGQLHNIVQ